LEAKCCGYVVEYEFMHQQLETINSNEQWILLAKQINHCKVKITCCISWAFYAPSKSFSPKMNSSFDLTSQELLKFVICYFIVSLASLKKGLITYWNINGIFSFREHLESTHQKNWEEWNELERVGVTSVGLKKEKKTGCK